MSKREKSGKRRSQRPLRLENLETRMLLDGAGFQPTLDVELPLEVQTAPEVPSGAEAAQDAEVPLLAAAVETVAAEVVDFTPKYEIYAVTDHSIKLDFMNARNLPPSFYPDRIMVTGVGLQPVYVEATRFSTFVVENLAPNTKYTLAVTLQQTDGFGNVLYQSHPTSLMNVTTSKAQSPDPTNLQIAAEATSVTLQWKTTEGYTYSVFSSRNDGRSWSKHTTSANGVYVVNKLRAETNYLFKVVANASKTTVASTGAVISGKTLIAAAAPKFKVTEVGSDFVLLSLTNAKQVEKSVESVGKRGYIPTISVTMELYQNKAWKNYTGTLGFQIDGELQDTLVMTAGDGSKFNLGVDFASSVNLLEFSGLTANTKVRLYAAFLLISTKDGSPFASTRLSNTVSFTTRKAAAPAPAQLEGVVTGCDSVKLTWSPGVVALDQKYTVQSAVFDKSGNLVKWNTYKNVTFFHDIAEPISECVIRGLKPDTSYRFRVIANAGKEMLQSNPAALVDDLTTYSTFSRPDVKVVSVDDHSAVASIQNLDTLEALTPPGRVLFLTYSVDNSRTFHTFEADELGLFLISNLESYTKYGLVCRAQYGTIQTDGSAVVLDHASPESKKKEFRTEKSVAPQAGNVVMTATACDSLRLTWNGDITAKYTIQIAEISLGGSLGKWKTAAKDVLCALDGIGTYDIYDLKPNTAYMVSIQTQAGSATLKSDPVSAKTVDGGLMVQTWDGIDAPQLQLKGTTFQSFTFKISNLDVLTLQMYLKDYDEDADIGMSLFVGTEAAEYTAVVDSLEGTIQFRNGAKYLPLVVSTNSDGSMTFKGLTASTQYQFKIGWKIDGVFSSKRSNVLKFGTGKEIYT